MTLRKDLKSSDQLKSGHSNSSFNDKMTHNCMSLFNSSEEKAEMKIVCKLIHDLCVLFRSVLSIEDEQQVCNEFQRIKCQNTLKSIPLHLKNLCHTLQNIHVDDLSTLVSVLVDHFQKNVMAVSLSENMLDSVDQLFNSLSVNCFSQTLHQCTSNMMDLNIKNEKFVTEADFEKLCCMIRYILTTDSINSIALSSYLEQILLL